MNKMRSFIGRRRFLIAAGATPVLGFGLKKLNGIVNPVFRPGAAISSESHGPSDNKETYSDRYRHLLSPLKIGNVVLKNRFIQADSYPFFLQGPETFPTEQVISWYASVAKNGCAVVMCFHGQDPGDTKVAGGGHNMMPVWDKSDVRVQTYFAQMTDAIHFHGSRAAISMKAPDVEDGYGISTAAGQISPMGNGAQSRVKEAPVEMLQKMIEDTVELAKMYKGLGFDMAHFHMSYRRRFLSTALSPVLNRRTDKYGGSLENRARLPLELFKAIKKACGRDFLIGIHVSGEEKDGGYTLQDLIEYARIWEGALDILVVRGKNDNIAHASPFTFNNEYNPILDYSRILKESGVRMVIAPNGGFQDLDQNESHIATGKADMISMARSWWADSEYGQKAYEGRGEDVIPCVRCNDCHGTVTGVEGPPVSFCTVNPKYGQEYRMDRMIDAPAVSRKVAVIGGGPAGMKAAITAVERGHRVTLYEKSDNLGGQLKHADYPSFKWSLKDFKDYLVRQVNKSGIEVHLKTTATPEMIKQKGYDAVIVALGAAPFIPDIPGAEGSNVMAPVFAYGNKMLGKNIVVIGGEQIGTETGMHLAEIGHKVTLLTSDIKPATDANFIYLSEERWGTDRFKNFSFITEATVKDISGEEVTYVDAKGVEKSIQADNVVLYAGRKPRQEEALKFYGSANRFFMIGDCSSDGIIVRISEGNVRRSQRTAFAAASKI